MSDLYRLFDVQSRALKCIKGKTNAGQMFDSCATTIHFEYSDLTFLEPSPSGEDYKPYIIFNIRDENGVPLCYGLQSNPVFDGYSFSIPWDVTSRVKGNRLEYQLCFSRNTYEVDERGVVKIVSDPNNILSSIDGIILKPSVTCKPPAPATCLPPVPYTQPNIGALLQMFQDYGVVVPVQQVIDSDTDRLTLLFRTYSGLNDCAVALPVPYLTEDGRIPGQFYDIITQWADAEGLILATDDNLPSALLVYNSLEAKLDDSQLTTQWTSEPSDERIPSELLVKDSLDKKVDDSQLMVAWSDPLSDTNIPSEKLVKESLDQKTDKLMAIPSWDNGVTYSKDSTVIYGGTIYISLVDDNLNNPPDMDDGSWSMVQGGGSGVVDEDGNFMTLVGDGTNTEFTVVHNLGTLNYFVTLRTNDAERRFVEARIRATNPNECVVSFTSPPAENGIVFLAARGDRTDSVYCETIGNGRDTSYYITHNLGMYNFFYELRDASGEYVDATVTAVNPVQAKIEFEYAPDVGEVTVMIAPCIPTRWAGRWVHSQVDASDTWVMDHDLNRIVQVQTYDMDGNEIYGQVVQSDPMLDTVTVLFSQPLTGMAVLQ